MAARGQSYVRSVVVDETPEEVIQRFITVAAGTREYTISTAGSNSVVFTRRFIPTWAVVVGVLGIFLFLIGLLAFLVKETETITITASESPDGTLVSISGVASAALIARLTAAASGASGVSAATRTAPQVDSASTWTCPTCGAENLSTASGCDVCGSVNAELAAQRMQAAAQPIVPRRECVNGHAVRGAMTRFCPECGAAMFSECTNGHEMPLESKFCGECGSPRLEPAQGDSSEPS